MALLKKYFPIQITTPALLERAVSIIFITGTFIGLLPLKYDKATNKIIKHSRFILLWSRIIALFESIVKITLITWVMIQLFLNIKDLTVTELISWVLALSFGGVCTLPYYETHVKKDVIKKIFEKVLTLNEQLIPLKTDLDLDRHLMKIFWLELIINAILTAFFIVALIYDTIIRKYTLKAILENLTGAIGTFVYAFVVQTFHGGLICVAHYTEIINQNLILQGTRIWEIKSGRDKFMKTSQIAKKFSDISWKIKRLMQLQENVHEMQLNMVKMYRWILLVMLGNIFVALIMQFQNFYLQMDTFINHGVKNMRDKDMNRFAFTVFISTFVLMQHFFLVHGPEIILERTDETKRLLLNLQNICIDKEIKENVRFFHLFR